MGCVCSRLARADLKQEFLFANADYTNHVVSLTSSTYGVLKLDEEPIKEAKISPLLHKSQAKVREEPPEIIDANKLMEDLDEKEIPICSPGNRNPQIDGVLHEQRKTPKTPKRYIGKENRILGRLDSNPNLVAKPFSPSENLQNSVPTSKIQSKSCSVDRKMQCFENDSGVSSFRRRSLTPLFDPELLASFERELSEEGEQIKKMVSPEPRSRKTQNSDSMLKLFEKKCPPGGENAVVVYTTTLRGIRKTFEDCNRVRSVIESHNVRLIERDISMDLGFREELRLLMGKKEVRVPLVFVKGRLIGGVDEVVKMEEVGRLGILFEGIPIEATAGCDGCGGLRFIMCMDCSGSCKVLDEEEKKMVRCAECNENGLIQCPICC